MRSHSGWTGGRRGRCGNEPWLPLRRAQSAALKSGQDLLQKAGRTAPAMLLISQLPRVLANDRVSEMEEKAVNDWLDIAPEYLNFLLTFMWNPPRAFAGVAGSGKIFRALTFILFVGSGFSYLLVLIVASP